MGGARKLSTEILISLVYEINIVKSAAESILELVNTITFLDNTDISSEEWFQNNVAAREVAKLIKPILSGALSFKNQFDFPVLVLHEKEEYLVPAESTFYLRDVIYLNQLKDKFDLILLDPPWENKLNKRKKGYSWLYHHSLLNCPIEELCNPGCLIVIWVTNNKNQIAFVEKELFQKWNVKESVMWHWVKVTKKGHFVYPIDSQHKKPYENLLLGYVATGETSDLSHIKELEPHKTIVSVPSSIHSNKPPLVEVLQPYLPENPKCLEVFARYLLPGWTSIGNEVIQLQNSQLFERVPTI